MEHGIALFLAFLSQQSVQQAWYEHTGYLPLERQLCATSPVQSTVLDIATFDLYNPSEPSVTQLLGPKNQIRAINDQMLEAIFSGLTDVDKAIQKAGHRINHAWRRFEKNTYLQLHRESDFVESENKPEQSLIVHHVGNKVCRSAFNPAMLINYP